VKSYRSEECRVITVKGGHRKKGFRNPHREKEEKHNRDVKKVSRVLVSGYGKVDDRGRSTQGGSTKQRSGHCARGSSKNEPMRVVMAIFNDTKNRTRPKRFQLPPRTVAFLNTYRRSRRFQTPAKPRIPATKRAVQRYRAARNNRLNGPCGQEALKKEGPRPRRSAPT